MSAESAIAEGRAAALATMPDIFTAYEPTVASAGGMKQVTYTSHGTTPGKLQGRGAADTTTRTTHIGGVDRPVVDAGLHLPVDSTRPRAGDQGIGWEYVLSTPGPLTDPALTDSRWLVVGAPEKSLATARRLDVVRIS